MELSSRILRKFSGVGLAKASVKELKNTFGLGSGKRAKLSHVMNSVVAICKKKSALLLSPKDIWDGTPKIFVIIKRALRDFLWIPEIRK